MLALATVRMRHRSEWPHRFVLWYRLWTEILPMLDGLSDAEWRELTELVVTCPDDRLASVVHDITRIPKHPATSFNNSARKRARVPRQFMVTTRIQASGWFYRTLLDELRRQCIH